HCHLSVLTSRVPHLDLYSFPTRRSSDLLLQSTDASKATPDAVFDLIAASTPLRTVTTPDEFAAAIMIFLSPYSRAVTGQNLIVEDRKSTRLNSSHVSISYAVFCLKKKNT